MSETPFQPFIEDLRKGKLVAIPTETVYGLAASIFQTEALQNIFKTKRRPFFDPLIVHVSSIEQAKALVKVWPPLAQALAEAFWPGPLTLVLEKSEKVSDLITSGLSTVGIRMPRHDLTLKLIEAFGEPLAAPSANLFGRTSPTLAKHVREEFSPEVVSVLDGGPCQIGIESTILGISVGEGALVNLQILRQGMIGEMEISKALTDRGFQDSRDFSFKPAQKKLVAPGQLQHHYMPSKPLILVSGDMSFETVKKRVKERIYELPDMVEEVSLVKPERIEKIERVELNIDAGIAARELYAELRRAAEIPCDILVFYLGPEHQVPEWQPLLDRLYKAASLTLSY